MATAALAVFLVAGNLLTVVGLPVTPDVMVAAGIFFAAIPLLGLQTNFLAFLQGLLDVRGLATQRSLAVLIATGLCVPLVWVFGLIGAATTFLILNALLTLLLGLRCRALGYGWLAVRLDRRVIGVLAAFGLVSMIAGFAQTFADAAIRASLLKELGPDANGLLQAPLSSPRPSRRSSSGASGPCHSQACPRPRARRRRAGPSTGCSMSPCR